MTYTLKLDGGKYTIINGAHEGTGLEFRRYGEPWPAADDLKYTGVVLAMAYRIEELETAIRAALDGTLNSLGQRHANGMRHYLGHPMIGAWHHDLTHALEQKP